VEHPSFGSPFLSTRAQGVRRVLLRRTRYHLYYRIVGDDIEILAFWHAGRGTPPPL
jgi:plasmid stabilization system protein ParE